MIMMELYLVVIHLHGAWLDRLILIALPVLDGVRVVEIQEVEGGIVALARHVNVQRLQEAAELLPIEGAAVVRVELHKRRLVFFHGDDSHSCLSHVSSGEREVE